MLAKADVSRRNRIVLALARAWFTLRHPFLIMRFVRRLGYLPNPAAPESYHERLLWRKIVDRNPLFVTLTDKLAAKRYIRGASPDLKLPATLWSGSDPAAIPPDLLAGNVVVKVNHGCEMNIFVSEGRPDRAAIIDRTSRWLKRRFGLRNGEWSYWPVVPAVFVEERLKLCGGTVATDIKVHVCGGTIAHVWVEDTQADKSLLFDRDAVPLPGRDPDYPREDQALAVTERLVTHVREAISLAPRIAGDLDYIRVDFLVAEDGLYGGEIAVYTAAGYGTWTNPAIAREIERCWQLEQSGFLRRGHRGAARLYAQALRDSLQAKARTDAGSRFNNQTSFAEDHGSPAR